MSAEVVTVPRPASPSKSLSPTTAPCSSSRKRLSATVSEGITFSARWGPPVTAVCYALVAGVLVTQEGLRQFDTDGPPITLGSITFTSRGQHPKDCQTPVQFDERGMETEPSR